MSLVHLYSGIVLLMIYTGFLLRRKRKIHIPLMISSFTLDLFSILYLELNRNVIFKAYEEVSRGIMQIHLFFAVTTLIGYGIAIYTGRKIARSAMISEAIQTLHKVNAFCFLTARTGVFVTSFWVLRS